MLCGNYERVGAERTFFTHMGHDIGLHDEVNMALPENVMLAYDGQVVEFWAACESRPLRSLPLTVLVIRFLEYSFIFQCLFRSLILRLLYGERFSQCHLSPYRILVYKLLRFLMKDEGSNRETLYNLRLSAGGYFCWQYAVCCVAKWYLSCSCLCPFRRWNMAFYIKFYLNVFKMLLYFS